MCAWPALRGYCGVVTVSKMVSLRLSNPSLHPGKRMVPSYWQWRTVGLYVQDLDSSLTIGFNQQQLRDHTVDWLRPARETAARTNVPAVATLTLTALMVTATLLATWIGGAQAQALNATYGLRSTAWAWTDVPGYSRLITYAFLHVSGGHFFWNVTLMLLVGATLEWRVGWRTVGLLIVTGAVVAGLSHLLIFPVEPRPLVGASGIGATFFGAAVVVAGGVGVRVRIPRTGRWLSINLRRVLLAWLTLQIIELTLIYAAPGRPFSVAYWAHLAGFGVGVSIALIHRARSAKSPEPALVRGFAGAGD